MPSRLSDSSSQLRRWCVLASLLFTVGLAAPASADPVLAIDGDIACGADSASTASCKDAATADLVSAMNPDAVLALGDIQYEHGQLENFRNYYDKTWGRFKSITRPVAGNHEYGTAGAAGYFDYFNGVGQANGLAGERGKGYYSFNIGSWHIVALNSNCQFVACAAGSEQERWLRADLAANTSPCTIAYWHHPRWSSDANHLGNASVSALTQALYESRVDLLFVGHAHIYERFAPQTPDGAVDTANGLTQFTVGTGGRSEASLASVYSPNSRARSSTLGALKLGLHSDYYDYKFVPIPGETYTDSGSAVCHGAQTDQQRILTMPSTADATARSDKATTNYGRTSTMQADGKPRTEAFVKFNVDGINGAKVDSAKLRLFAEGSSKSGGTISTVGDSSWSETSLNWNNRPSKGTALKTLGAVTGGRWYEVDVTSAVARDGLVSFAVSSTSNDGVSFSSREGGTAVTPQLVVTATPGDTTAPTVPATPRATVASPTRVELSWAPSSDAVGVTGYRVFRDGVAIATSDTASYADSTVTGGATHRYSVAAYDAAGNESGRSGEVSATTPPPDAAGTLTFLATEDTYVNDDYPGANHGAESTMIFDGSPKRNVFMKFNVSGIPDAGVAKAVLQVRAENESVFGGNVRRVGNTGWSQGTMTWLSQPSADAEVLGTLPATSFGTSYQVDVTPAVTGNGAVSLRIDSNNADGGAYYTSEAPLGSTGANKTAKLIVTTR